MQRPIPLAPAVTSTTCPGSIWIIGVVMSDALAKECIQTHGGTSGDAEQMIFAIPARKSAIFEQQLSVEVISVCGEPAATTS